MRMASTLIAVAFVGLALFAYHDHVASRARPSRPTPTVPAAPEDGASLERARYELVVDPAGTTPVEGGFRVRVSSGDEVELREVTVTSYLSALSPCPRTSPTRGVGSATMGVLRALLLPAVAHAGHTAESDASELLAPRIEPLAGASSTFSWGERTFARRRYCGVQYVATRATTPETLGRFEELATFHASVRILARGARPERTFAIHTTLAAGKQETLDTVFETDSSLAPHLAVVRIERSLGAAFRDVDFALEGRELERSVLRGLSSATRVRVFMRSRSGA